MNGQWTDYPTLREHLAPGFAELTDEQIDALVEQVYGPGFTGEDLEGFFDTLKQGLGHVAGAVGNFAQKAAPAVAGALRGSLKVRWQDRPLVLSACWRVRSPAAPAVRCRGRKIRR